MATHYEVLGVRPTSTPEEVRRAYHEQARRLHPDRAGGAPDDARAMQDVNEAWRVLRDPGRRAAYDRSLGAPAGPPAPTASTAPAAPAEDVDDWDRPIPQALAEPGDVVVMVVRSLPWIAVLLVLGAIFVFTAFARTGGADRHDDLIGRCIATEEGWPVEVPCDGPNEGTVTLVVDRQQLCPAGTSSHAVAGGRWYCVRPAGSGP